MKHLKDVPPDGGPHELWPTEELRRWFHRNPELGHQEIRTAEFIEERLREFGFRDILRPAPTSVCALLGHTKNTILVRADIDALPIDEINDGRPYRSTISGVMHACGHDAHSAIVLDVARRLFRKPPTDPGGVLFVFQQAEEIQPSGAPLVIKGLPHSFEFLCGFGLHVWPELESGFVGLRSGPLLAGIDGFTIRLNDPEVHPAHGSKAESGSVDLISCAASIITGLKSWLRGRTLTEESPVALHIGLIRGGDLPNRFPDTVELRGTLRWLRSSDKVRAWREIGETIQGLCGRVAAVCTINIEPAIRPAVINDPQVISFLRGAARGSATVVEPYPTTPLGVSDDFGAYGNLCPTAMLLLGCRKPNRDIIHLHDPRFDIDEEILNLGASILERAVRERLATRT